MILLPAGLRSGSLAVALLALLLVVPTSLPPGGVRGAVAQSADEPAVQTVISGLATPWGLAFTPDGRTFFTERDTGVVRELVDGAAQEVHDFDIDPAGEGGLLGLAVSPDWGQDGWLYTYMTTSSDNRIVRFRPDTGATEVLLSGIPSANIHNGGRLAFGPDGLLYATTGDAATGGRAQDLASLGGKILRIGQDGSVPAANPFDGSPVLSYGHRNVQGLAWDGAGRLFATEFGPDRDDEINRIEPGGNYGWPHVTGEADTGSFIDPVFVRQPPEASWSGAAVVDGSGPSGLRGDLLAAGLRGERLWRLDIAGGAVVGADSLYQGRFGRLRTVEQAPDGSVWLVTGNYASGNDRLLRIGGEAGIAQACPEDQVDDAGFVDVPPGNVHDHAIDCLATYGVATGVATGRYAPKREVTRAQLASFAARLLGLVRDLPAGDAGRFRDVAPASPHADAIGALAALDVLEGTSATTFHPGRAVTRAQATTMLVGTYRELAGEELPAGGDAFVDDDGSVHEANLDAAAAAGIVAGVGGGRFLPGNAVSRDQTASLLARTLDVAVRRAGVDPQP